MKLLPLGNSSSHNGAERNIIAKEYRNYVDCIRVTYALGKTRWVPVERIYQ